MKILFELRPALAGHAGIPQESRLLFRGLSRLDGIEMQGLLQSGSRVIARGLDPRGSGPAATDKEVNRLSRAVVSLNRGTKNHVLAVQVVRLLLNMLTGQREPLSRFDATLFGDFIWRAMFDKTLHPDDLETVTRAAFRIARVPWSAVHGIALGTRVLGHALYPRLDTTGLDVMLAETPYPGRVTGDTRLVVRYHDAVPLLMPHTIADRSFHQASHYHALRRNLRDGAWFSCVSEATRRDLLSIFPDAAERAVTIHNMVSHHYFAEDSAPDRLPDIVRTRATPRIGKEPTGAPPLPGHVRGEDFRYLLMVSTIEPRKNHQALLSAWEHLRASRFPDLHLVLVGALGWDHKSIVRRMRPWLRQGSLHLLEEVPAAELRLLYRHALATICPSVGEGFDYSGVEAMRCGSVVIASDLPVHREVFDDASLFFMPYAPSELANAVQAVSGPEGLDTRRRLVARGAEVAERYLPERLLPRWQDFLQRVCAAPARR